MQQQHLLQQNKIPQTEKELEIASLVTDSFDKNFLAELFGTD